MRRLACLFGLWISLALAPAWAQQDAGATAEQLRQDLARQTFVGELERDGFIDAARAEAIRRHYFEGAGSQPAPYADEAPRPAAVQGAGPADEQTDELAAAEPSFWERYFTWSHFIKLIAVALLLLAFARTLGRLIAGAWKLFAAVPQICYQLILLAPTLLGLLQPAAISVRHTYYIALACSFILPMVLYWMMKAYPAVTHKLFGFVARLPTQRFVQLLCLLGLLYTGGLAVLHQSAILGFLAAACLSGLLSFTLYYGQGTLLLMLGRNDLGAAIVGHLLVLGSYVGLQLGGHLPAQAHYFAAGLEYYGSLALGTALLLATSPWSDERRMRLVCTPLFILLFVLASVGFFMLDVSVISVILMGFFCLFALEWIAYLGYQRGAIVGSALLGAALYGLAMLLDHYSGALYAAFAQG